MSKTWGYVDEAEVESVLCRDRTEELEQVLRNLDSAALGRILVTAKALVSTRMLAAS
jgi:hypothetical protein